MRRVVIVGGGLAAHRAATALRREGFDGELTLVGDEPHRPYDRPPLSKQLLAGKVEVESCFYPTDDLQLEWLLGRAAARLDRGRRVVVLDDGEEVAFDGLVAATGRRARSWPGRLELEGLMTLRGLDDALALRAAAQADTRVAIIGAGFVGSEVASTLSGLGVRSITLIDVAAHPMPGLGPALGGWAARAHAAAGVDLRLGTGVASIEGRGRVEEVRLDDGERIGADLVLVALGSVPNTEWLQGAAGLELLEGNLLCDEECFAVGAEEIVAAGDMAAFPHRLAGGPIWVEHWSNAREMGARAGANLLAPPGSRLPYRPTPSFWTDQYEAKIRSTGILAQADELVAVEDDPEKPALVIEARKGGKVVGAAALNRSRAVIGYQQALQDEGEAGAAAVADGGRR